MTDITIDVAITYHGSVCVITGVSDEGKAWVEEHLPDVAAQRWAGGIVAEPRYVPAIIAGAMADGLEIDA